MKLRKTANASEGAPFDASLLDGSSFVACLEIGPDGSVRRANRCFLDLVGAAEHEVVGRALTDLVVERKSWSAWHADALAGHERGVRLTFDGPSGHRAVLKGDLFRRRDAADESIVGIFVDVGEEMRLRDAVQRGARMEALGSLTSGIAHDFNNLLTVLVGNLYLVAEELRTDEGTFRRLKAARDAAKRGADLIKQLLAFARRETLHPEEIDPGKVVAGLAPLLRRALGPKVALDARTAENAGRVRCNAGQLESVIVNLAMNARDAIAESGRIVIATEAVELKGRDAQRRGIPPGAYIRVSVADSGCGIPPEKIERVFEPFFTTKGDRGTGLGLSMVRWFAQQAGGAVWIASASGRGTEVFMLLPKSTDLAAETMSKTAPLSTLPGGNETVVVFAYDESVRSTIEQILRVLGYGVQSASRAEEALELLRGRRAEMLVLDGATQDAPSRRGFLRAAAEARPGIRIVMTVDAADGARERRSTADPWLLPKPFSIPDLARTVRRALDAEPPAAR